MVKDIVPKHCSKEDDTVILEEYLGKEEGSSLTEDIDFYQELCTAVVSAFEEIRTMVVNAENIRKKTGVLAMHH